MNKAKIARQIESTLNSPDLSDAQKDVLGQFDQESAANNMGAQSSLNYLRVLKVFGAHIGKPYKDVTKSDVMSFVNGLDIAPSSLSLYKVCLKRFYKWLYQLENEYPPVVKWLKTTRSNNNKKLPEALLTPEEVKAMVSVADNLRDRALIMCLYESACRADEILTVKNRNVQFDKYGAVIMVKGKTGMRRIRLIDSVPDLTAWMNIHPQKKADSPLFINLSKKGYGDPLGYDGLLLVVKKLAKRAGIEKRVHPHLFRHSRITHWARDDFTESDMKVMAGWTGGSQMPAIYVHLSGGDTDKKVLAKYGKLPPEEKEKETKRPLAPKTCPRCETENPPTAKFCYRCSAVLDIKTAVKLQERVEGMYKIVPKDSLLSAMLEDEEIKTAATKWLLKHGSQTVLNEVSTGTHWASIIDEIAHGLTDVNRKKDRER